LNKSLYGLKQGLRSWYARMDAYLKNLGFVRGVIDPNLYIKVFKNDAVIIFLYVDEWLIIGMEHCFHQCKKDIIVEFDMNDLGLMHYCLRIEIW